ncbi:MAG: RHS repeat protein, partial [Gammaproteobacteria bacterium]|nr:RHS repeat protein [Gammaproteobacteria bacterium]
MIEARNIASEKDSESRNIPLNGAPSLANLDQIQKFSYGVDGRLLEDWDANFNANVSEEYGANNKYTYDAVGNVRTQSLNRHDADGNLFTDIAEYIYDRLNRNIVSGKRTEKNSSVYAYFENKYTEYNGYEKAAFQGAYERNTLQLSRPEANKARQVFFEYDSNGNLIKTNSDGVVKEYAYDRNGNATKEILPSITDNNAPSVYRSSVYNERNELVHIYEPSHTQSISQTLYQTLSDRKVDIEVTPYGGLHLRVHDAVGKDWAETWWDAVDPNVDS